ncbi:hypothetical protein [Scytonema sp. PCC 10023]|uniref:hypothetical protein n=1 Tax=Scytonema sp. PCC 10023 TaxID=1680591 RepID=UPI0039C6557B
MKTSNNGTKPTQDLQQFELVSSLPEDSDKKKKPRESKNPLINCSMVLDAGSKRIKSLLNNYPNTIDSIYKEVKGELPSGMAGCFRYKNKNYAVGRGCDAVLGELVEAQKDNKIKKLDIWLLGVLTSDPDFLDELLEDKRNRYKSKPIRLGIDIKLLSLSSNKQGEIVKILQGIENFTYRGREFTIEFKNLDSEFIYSEGYGAALTARKLLSKEVNSFSILDLGGGTLTLTTYKIGRNLPKVINRSVASGGGMQDLARQIFISLNKTDIGGETKSLNSIFEALKACRADENSQYVVPYRVGNKTENITESVLDGISNWIADNPSISDILTKSSQVMVSGGSVFATGGGFASKIIGDKLQSLITNVVNYGQFQILENPDVINVLGMNCLDQ